MAFRFNSIRTKIMFSIFIIILILQITTMAVQHYQVSSMLIERMEKKAITSSSAIILDTKERLESFKTLEEKKDFLEIYAEMKGRIVFPSLMDQISDLEHISFVDDSGKIIVVNGGGEYLDYNALKLIEKKKISSLETDNALIVFVPFETKEGFMGGLIFSYSNLGIIKERNELLFRSITLLMAYLVLGIIIAFLISSAITRPVKILTMASILMAKGKLDKRVKVESNDEIGILAKTFEVMRLAIIEQQRELGEYSKTLEKEVRQRTAQLEKEKKEAEKLAESMVGRELKMVELKKKIKKLKKSAGKK